MLTLLIPAGLFLRAYGLKAAGNALVGIALALYFIYPFMIIQIGQAVTVHMANELKSQPSSWLSCNNAPICCMGIGTTTPAPGETSIQNGDQPSVSAKSIIKGNIAIGNFCMFNTMLPSLWGTISSSWSGGLGLGSLAFGIGTYALLKWLNLSFLSIAMLVPLATFVQMAGYETVYFLFIISAVLPIFVVFITITMAREIAKVLGTEIDLSALEKLI
jgi:hypothetical protein